jgi:PAS domain S-box-containing protein
MSNKITESEKSLIEKKRVKKKRNTQELRKDQGKLERRIEKQTAELTKANKFLKQERDKHKQAVQTLQENERMLSTLLSNLPGYSYRCKNDKDWTLDYISDGVFKITGYKVVEFLVHRTITCGEKTHPDDCDRVWDEVQAALKNRQHFELVYRIITKSNTEKWVWERGQGIYSSRGKLLFIEGFVTDITESKRKEWELQVVNSITQAINRPNKLEDIYKIALDKVIELEYVDIAGIYLVDETSNEAVLQAHSNFPDDYIKIAVKIPYPKGVTWKVINTGKILNINNVQKDPDIGPAGRDLGHHGALGIPIISDTKKVIGVIWLLSYKEHQFTQMEVDFLTSIGNQVAIAIARANLYKELSKKSRYESTISAVTQSVHKSLDLQEVLENAVESMSTNMDNVKNVSIYMVEGDEAVVRAHRGYSKEYIKKAGRIPRARGTTWKTIIEGKPRYVADAQKDEVMGPAGKELGTKSYLSMPIHFEGRTIGAININSTVKDAFDEDELTLLQIISHQIEVAVSNAQNVEALKKSEHMIKSITEGTSLVTGAEFFPSLVCHLAQALHVPYASVSEFINGDENNSSAQIISVWTDDSYVEPYKYDLKGTPCENAKKGEMIYYPRNIKELFPDDYILADMGAESYLGIPLKNSSGNIIGILCVMDKKPMDNPDSLLPVLQIFAARAGVELERLRAEEQLIKLSSVIEQTADAVMITDKEGVIEYINPAFEKLTGYSRDEVIGSTPRILKSGVHKSEFYENLWGGILSGTVYQNVFTNRKKGGEPYNEEKTITPIKDMQGNITHFVSTGKDITEKMKMEEELVKAQKLESISILAGGIAHDFNNLLTVILGNVSLANRYVNEDDVISKTMLEDTIVACERAKDLTYQLLTFSKGGAPVKKLSGIDQIVMDSARFSLMGSGSKCEFYIPDNISSVEVDEGQISQVIQNLIINADQAMPEGGIIKIRIENATLNKKDGLPLNEGRYVMVCIEDQGIGILPEHISKIFDPYFTTKQTGSGLGLATTYSVIKNHNGYIKVESRIGGGTKFIFYLPASEEKVLVKHIEEGILEGSGKVLIMDDDINIGNMLNLLLNNLGYGVEVVTDGTAAIKLYKKNMQERQPFDAVILDLTVAGGMGGKETMERLLEIDPGIKAIVSSGYSSDPVMSEYKQYGFCGCIAKPYKIEQLSGMLQSIIAGDLN